MSREHGTANDSPALFDEAELEQSVPSRFGKLVARHPDHVAVKTADGLLSYRDLNASANRIASAILAACSVEDQVVVLLLENGAAFLAATLGVLKAGKAYLALEPSQPWERIARTVRDSGASLLVTDDACLPTASSLAGIVRSIISLDELAPSLPDECAPLTIPPDRVAGLYYTSGSTGEPRGVPHTHQHLLHTAMTVATGLGVSSADRIPLLTSGSFAYTMMALYGGLLNGATLYPCDLRKESISDLARRLASAKITFLAMVPSGFRDFVSMITDKDVFLELRCVMLSGEPVLRRDAELFREHMPRDCLLVNQYGSSETGMISWFRITRDMTLPSEILPVGYSTLYREILILGEDGRPLAPGQVGEIAVRGRYLPRGYWRRLDLSEAKFLEDPADPRQRIYLTGDIGRMAPDGCLTCLGRKDSQVKVRGHRVEINEVEAALIAVPGVAAAVVTAKNTPEGDHRLVAYVVRRGEPLLTVSRLRVELCEKLPDYMIPTAFVFMDVLPLTPTGKLDRTALPDPEPVRPEMDIPCLVPRTGIEKELARIWEDVLGIRPVGVNDNFFELGGHSLAAARIFAKIEERFGRSLSAASILQAPTVKRLAAMLHEGPPPCAWASLVELQPGGARPPLFCVEAKNAGIFVHLARRLGPDQPVYGLHPLGLAARVGQRLTVEGIAAHYLGEVRAIQPHGPYFLCGRCAGGVIAFEMARQLQGQEETVAFLALFDTFCPGGVRIAYHVHRIRQRIRKRYLHPGREHWRRMAGLALGKKLSYLLHAWEAARRKHAAARTASDAPEGRYLKELHRVMHHVHKAQRKATLRYRPSSYPGRILHFHAGESQVDSDMGAREGWKRIASGGVTIHVIRGRHDDIFREPHVGPLADLFRDYLQVAQGRDAACQWRP